MLTKPSNTLSPGRIHFLCIITFVIFLLSPITQVGDSQYSLLVSQNIILKGRCHLDEYFAKALPYQVQRIGGHVCYSYPPGGSILGVPFVATANLLGVSVVDVQGTYSKLNEWILQKIIAAILATAFLLLLYKAARLMLDEFPALWITALMGLGSSIWSIASRAVWSHTWGILLVMASIYILAKAQARKGPSHPLWIGTLLSWAFFCRPTFILPVLGIAVYFVIKYPRQFWTLAVAGVFWGMTFWGWDCIIYGQSLPPYYMQSQNMSLEQFSHALATDIISPSRGLFIFMPWLTVTLYMVWRYWHRIPLKGLAIVAITIICAHSILIAAWPCWWFGHSFGPRGYIDTLPWWGLLTILGAVPLCQDLNCKIRAARITLRILVLLGALSIMVHAGGALSHQSHLWNYLPRDINEVPQRVWDWGDSQAFAFLLRQNTHR